MTGSTIRLAQIALALVLATTTAPVWAEPVSFAGGLAQAETPSGYSHSLEDGGSTLLLVSNTIAGAELRFTFHSLADYVSQAPTIGKDFVLDAARQREKEVFAVPGNGGVAFVDLVETSGEGADADQHTRGVMGTDDAYVVFSVSMPVQSADTPSAKELLSVGIAAILGGIDSRKH